jgi:CRP-like cAMP-binding protein
METIEQLLGEHPFIRGLSDDHVALLAGCAQLTRFDGGQFLFREGERARSFYLIRRGRIAITTVTPQQGLITIQTVGDGDVLGWSWLVSPYEWHFGARALEPTAVLTLNGDCVRGKCEEDHVFGFLMMRRFAQVMASRLEAMHLQLLNVYEHSS